MTNDKTQIPDAAELVEAVAAFLEDKLLPELSGARRFEARVAVNALRIVGRELSAGDDEALADNLRALLGAAAGGADTEALLLRLAEGIRTGDLEEDDPALLAALRRYALGRLAINNPRYSSYLAAKE